MNIRFVPPGCGTHDWASIEGSPLAAGTEARHTLRGRLAELLTEGAAEQSTLQAMLHPAAQCTLHLPADIGDYRYEDFQVIGYEPLAAIRAPVAV